MGYSPRYHFYTSQWPNHHSETDDWAVIESEIKSARESGSTPADYSGYVIDTHTGKRTDFGLKGIVENSDVPAPPEPREPEAREAVDWLIKRGMDPDAAKILAPDFEAYSAYTARLFDISTRALLKEKLAAERSLLQARAEMKTRLERALADAKEINEYAKVCKLESLLKVLGHTTGMIIRLERELASTSAPEGTIHPSHSEKA